MSRLARQHSQNGIYHIDKKGTSPFVTCNSGNSDVYNLAYAFKIRMGIKDYIIAWDGGTIFNYDTGKLEAGAYGTLAQEMKRQFTWYKYVDKDWMGIPKRVRIGYRQIEGGVL